jgi:ABC-type polysaccharide/polyol phosphate transport system ATPase subunit
MTASNPLSPERELAVECSGVTKDFFVYTRETRTMREFFIRLVKLQKIRVRRRVFSLSQFDLSVGRGEAVALIGNNGSGKSTILRLVAGIYEPTHGSIRTVGRIAAVIELGAGFHLELTGHENVDLYGSIIGIPIAQMATYRERTFAFADIDEFIDLPTKYYSSGMIARLAFAVAVCSDPDILVLDEVLAVGDGAFREKCYARLRELRASGATLIVASHDFHVLGALCDRAVWLQGGAVIQDGAVQAVIGKYRAQMAAPGR